MTYKQKIDKLFNNPEFFKKIEKVAVRETTNTIYHPEDLVAELYIYLIDNEQIINKIKKNSAKEERNTKEDPILVYCCAWMVNNIRLFSANKKDSNFQAKFGLRQNIVSIDVNSNDEEKKATHIQLCQDCDEIVDDYFIVDEENKNDEKIKYAIYDQVIKNLEPSDKKLYKLYFLEENNNKQIQKMFPNITTYGVYQMIASLKKKIKTECEKKYYDYKKNFPPNEKEN